MTKSASDEAKPGAAEAVPEGPRERLARAFLRELPAQLGEVLAHWERAAEGDAGEHTATRRRLHRLAREAHLLHLPGHFLLLEALEECVASLETGAAQPERVAVAVGVALHAVGRLEGNDTAPAEREAAQLRWLTQDSEAMSSGVFPRRLRK